MDSRHLADIRAGTAGACLRSGSGYRTGPTLIRVLLVSGRAADAVEPLLHAIGMGRQLHGDAHDLAGESAAVPHRAYLEDAEGVGAAFRAITGEDIPTCITHPPTEQSTGTTPR